MNYYIVSRILIIISIFLQSSILFASPKEDPFKVDSWLNANHDLEVIGWSDDENYYAIRLYSLRSRENYFIEGGEFLPRNCEGYISHSGRKFNGGLSIHIFNNNNVVENHPVQDAEQCTPFAIAKDRLRKAKVALKKYGIRLESPGEKMQLEDAKVIIKDKVHGQYTLEYTLTMIKTPDKKYRDYEYLTGNHELYLVKEEINELILRKPIDERFDRTMIHRKKMGIENIYLSPSKEKILIYCYTDDSGMTHQYRALWLFGILQWRNNVLMRLDKK